MSEDLAAGTAFPPYVERTREERLIRDVLAKVRADGQSRAVLLYGPGGMGKTHLVREMARTGTGEHTTWLDPIDADDPEYWLLSNLESQIASALDPDGEYFGPYRENLAQFPSYSQPAIRQETIVSHLGRIKSDFASCYEKRTRAREGAQRHTVVLAFDTVETIRGMVLSLTLVQWMKELPSTLFILAGRPQRRGAGDPDPIAAELESEYRRLPTTVVELGPFPEESARQYLDASPVCARLPADSKAKIACLTRGYPLWLAFTVDYLRSEGTPPELGMSLEELRARIPYEGELERPGQALRERFLGGLVTPYRETDFMHEAVKRLAVVRQGVTKSVWVQLMADRPLPPGVVTTDAAWDQLLLCPWVRQRAGGRLVTLQDAVAETLAQRIFPVHDQDSRWRQGIWKLAEATYQAMLTRENQDIDARGATLDTQLTEVDRQLRDTGEHQRRITGEHRRPTRREIEAGRPADDAPTEELTLIRSIASLDADRGKLDQLKAIHLYYLFLCDFSRGSDELLLLLDQAQQERNIQLTDLLAQETLRFVFSGPAHPLNDVIRPRLSEFHEWLGGDGRQQFLAIGLELVRYLIDSGRPRQALEMIRRLPADVASPGQRYRLSVLSGNAAMRLPDPGDEAEKHFRRALDIAGAMTGAERPARLAQVHKELGYYYRNVGLWDEASHSYREARDALSSPAGQGENRAEIASIQTNWAYTKGLMGSYDDALDLAENSIKIRQSLRLQQEEAMSWSVCGEVYRYQRRFGKARDAYAVAERILEGQQNWPWLGVIYQQQAICLFQQAEDDPGSAGLVGRARSLILKALPICRDQNRRNYPSALNRAGRIFGSADPETGLDYLSQGIDAARALSDGWFLLANLIEHAELSYREWTRTGSPAYREKIEAAAPEIKTALSRYKFLDLRGRWSLLQGHLAVRAYLENSASGRPGIARDWYRIALARYAQGFIDLAGGRVGSSGTALLPAAFSTFGKLIGTMPADIREELLSGLYKAWRNGKPEVATRLLAHLAALYEEVLY
jgi:tetratricopeptide (TPR) repeat protein